MACFVVAAAEAIVVTAAAQAKKKAEKAELERITIDGAAHLPAEESHTVSIPWSRKLMWLAYLLWGGVILLAFEHVWHGEVTPWFPFLTAALNPADLAEMFREMATTGVVMICLVTAVWACLVAIVSSMEKRAQKEAKAAAK